MTAGDAVTGKRSIRASTGPRRFGKTDLRRVGKVLRDQRMALGLSMRGLSERSGVSIAAIRALEAGQSNPSLGTVVPVVEALDLKLDRVISAARAAQDRVAITRAGSGEASLSRGLVDAVLSARLMSLPVESMRPTPPDASRHPSLGVVVSGSVIVSVDADTERDGTPRAGQRIRLESGDNYHARPGVVKSLANAANADARVLMVLDIRSGPARGEP